MSNNRKLDDEVSLATKGGFGSQSQEVIEELLKKRGGGRKMKIQARIE